MGLGLQPNSGSGEIRPFVKYDAKAGRMFRQDRVQNAGGQYESTSVDITRDATFVADLEYIKVGWINYTTQGPIKRLAVLGQEPIPPRPDDKNPEGKPAFKQGFELSIMLSKAVGGGPARDFGSTAGCVIEAVDALHDAYLAAPESKTGKLPVVKLTNTVPVKSGQSTNYKPLFEITSWVDRPAGLPVPSATPATPQPPAGASANPPQATTPPATGSTLAPPPPPAAPQPAATAAMDDFG